MYRIIKIGMDVHSKNYTLCAMEPVPLRYDPERKRGRRGNVRHHSRASGLILTPSLPRQ